MASSTHWLASQSAMAELEAGGNAFDAAIAAAFVLHVVEPHLNGPAGEVPAVFATADDPAPRVLCGQGTAPVGATREHYLGLGLELVPGSGTLAAAIPGAVDAWLMLGRDHGTRPLGEVLSYAIGYARAGHQLLPAAAGTVARVEQLFREHWATSAARWLPHGRLPRPWELVVNREHAATLERLVREGEAAGTDRAAQYEGARRAWREGFVAEAIDAFSRLPFRDSSGADHAGVLTGADLAGWSASYERPVLQQFRDVEVAKTDLWGQGPVLLQALAMLDGLPDEACDPTTPDGVHTVIEVLKLALADREAWYGDASPVTVAELLDPAYVEVRRALVGERASAELRPGSPGGRVPVLSAQVRGGSSPPEVAGLGEPAVSWDGQTRGDTCHIDVVDRRGNIISATPSGGWLQSSPTIPELGLLPGQPAPDVLARRRAASQPGPGSAAANHALPHPGAAGRAARAGLRHAWRRPAGPVATTVPAAPSRPRPRPPGGDRGADVPHHLVPELLLPAGDETRRAGGRGPPRLGRGRGARGSRPPAGARRGLDPGPVVRSGPGPGHRTVVSGGDRSWRAGVRSRALELLGVVRGG